MPLIQLISKRITFAVQYQCFWLVKTLLLECNNIAIFLLLWW